MLPLRNQAHQAANRIDPETRSPDGTRHPDFFAGEIELFDREPQRARMSQRAAARLVLPPAEDARIVDLGCGCGATTRQLLTENTGWHAVGIDSDRDQVETAKRRARDARLNHRVTFLCEDFTRTSFPAARFDGALAIEVIGAGKTALLREAKRLLRRGARLVVADAFFRDDRPLPPQAEALRRQLTGTRDCDPLVRKPAFTNALANLGFVDIHSEDISACVLPSRPGVAAGELDDLLKHPSMVTITPGPALAPLLALMPDLKHDSLGYFLVSATRE